ncbi:discoidin domain-containing protein [Myxococcus sp. RHSTA-1-4]|uniref:discoidin domain-containing protein n=1 Tax=Myxococcus sp. RHSTA-1-4 TaxID=2874601 RepID=UPI001CBD615A|nr:discoidin domain-containing protein [Myxococcus sp. RHSTA-1-4]MBZ4420676.1 discoidin domain-containing protein [Myxococcus sp. RHSTA-1-4]
MSGDDGRNCMRGWGPLRVILGCVLLSTGAWGQPTGAERADAGTPVSSESLDAGQMSPGALGPSGTPDAGPPNPGQVRVTLHGVPVTVTASSVLVDAKDPGRYGPANLLDEDPGTLWAEGAKGTGAGEWVELSFPPETPVHAFLVTPGNPKSAKLYKANARPRKARLELKLAEGRKLDYELDFPRDFPAGGSLYVHYRRMLPVLSARLTVLSVWPGTRYRDLCLGGFVPVFREPGERALDTFPGVGLELAPSLALFMESPLLVFKLLPPEASGVGAWLRSYAKVPHRGALPPPEEEFDMHRGTSEWSRYRRDLASHAAGATSQSELFRLLPEPDGRGYVFAPLGPPRSPDAYSNFRVHWARVDGAWHVVGLEVQYREQTADD